MNILDLILVFHLDHLVQKLKIAVPLYFSNKCVLKVRQWSDKIIKTVQRRWKVRKGTLEKTTHVMVTPRVVEEVRRHFNCPTLEGAELEDQGGDGTSFTHWEKRIFQNEAMTGTVHTAKPVYTRLTLALLEDSGWYIPDYSKGRN